MAEQKRLRQRVGRGFGLPTSEGSLCRGWSVRGSRYYGCVLLVPVLAGNLHPTGRQPEQGHSWTEQDSNQRPGVMSSNLTITA
jgi:hypothetical protein